MNKILPLLLILYSYGIIKAQESRHSVNLLIGTNITIENTIYIDFEDPDYEIWADPEHKLAWHLDYTYHFTDYLGWSGYAEYEKIKLEDYFFGDVEAKRIAIGTGFEVRYPQTALHGLSGGFFGLGTANSDDFDNPLRGIEYGLLIGPAYTLESIEAALLFKPKFSYYFSKDPAPESGLIMYPQIFLKLGYNF